MFALFLLVASTHFAALLSPGPDFFLLIRAALLKGRRYAHGCATGIALANLLSMLLVLLALSLLPAGDSGIWRLVQGLGGLYFVWLGASALASRRQLQLPGDADAGAQGRWCSGLVDGVLASSLNPKLPIFYAGLFGVLREAQMPGWGMALSMLWMTLVVLAWDLALVRLLAHGPWRDGLQRHVISLDRICGTLLLALGLWLLFG